MPFIRLCPVAHSPLFHLVSVVDCLQCRRPGWIPGSGRAPGAGNGNPLQYPCLENPMDRGAWWATVYGVARVGHDRAPRRTHSDTECEGLLFFSFFRWCRRQCLCENSMALESLDSTELSVVIVKITSMCVLLY